LPSGGSAHTNGALQVGQVRLWLVIVIINFVACRAVRLFQIELSEWNIVLSMTDENPPDGIKGRPNHRWFCREQSSDLRFN